MNKFAVSLVIILLLLPSVLSLDTKKPATLDGAVQQIIDMKKTGASPEEIASRITEIVDDRLINANSPEVLTESWRNLIPFGLAGDSQTHKNFLKWRDKGGAETDYENSARWAWENRYGQCAENTAVTYYIMKKAGLKNVRIINKPKHRFVMWGMDEEADLRDLNAYTDKVLVPDGWQGRVLKGDDIIRNQITSPSYGPSKDQTPEYDKAATEQCGYVNKPCCTKIDACRDDPELVCSEAVCKPCGRLGQRCCEDEVCREGATCVDNKCAEQNEKEKEELGTGLSAEDCTEKGKECADSCNKLCEEKKGQYCDKYNNYSGCALDVFCWCNVCAIYDTKWCPNYPGYLGCAEGTKGTYISCIESCQSKSEAGSDVSTCWTDCNTEFNDAIIECKQEPCKEFCEGRGFSKGEWAKYTQEFGWDSCYCSDG